MIKRIIGIDLIVGGLALWGMKGILAGDVANAWFAYFVNMGLVSKHVGYKWHTQLADLFPVLAACIACSLISFSCVRFFQLGLYVDGALRMLFFGILYMGWSFLFKPESFEYSKAIVRPMVSKIINRK